MRFARLNRALAATVLAVAVGSWALFAHLIPAAEGAPRASLQPVPLADASGRIYLTEAQSTETRNPLLWSTEMHSLLNVGFPMRHGDWAWNDRGVPAGRTTVRIDLKTQLISVVRGGHEIGTAVILFGGENHATPLGRFPVLSKNADYHSLAYDAPMPFALRLTQDGVAMHGSDVRPGRATHGCIGLPLQFAHKVFDNVAKGDEVLIMRS